MPAVSTIKRFDCSHCELEFPNKKEFWKHKREEHPKCGQCKVRFLTPTEQERHQRESRHCYCHACSIYFPSVRAQLDHAREVTHEIPYHCCDCNREYANQDALSYHCCTCDKVLKSQKQSTTHLSTGRHHRKVAKLELERGDLPNKCEECDKSFRSKKQLRNHKSSCHNRIRCPVGKSCKKFATPSALLSHLESGCCSSGMTRGKLHQLVFAHDPDRYITSTGAAEAILSSDPASISQFTHLPASIGPSSEQLSRNESPPLHPLSDDDNLSEWSAINNEPLTLTPSNSDWSVIGGGALISPRSENGSEWSFMSQDPVNTPSTMFPSSDGLEISSQRSAPPQNLRCLLCPPDRGPFSSIKSYQAHVNSAAHAPKIFHCPLSLIPNVKPEDLLRNRHFSTLGGLAQHLESGRCEGGLELYKKAISFVEEQLEHLGLGGLLLLSN